MKAFIKIMLLVAVGCSFVNVAQGQTQKTYFNAITIENGLPSSAILSYTQDKYGYLWFGTENGLVRYDGYQFKKYPFKDSTGNTISLCLIYSLHEDSHGTLWAYLYNEGIYTYNIKKDAFEKTKIVQEKKLYEVFDIERKWVEDKDAFWISHTTHQAAKNPKLIWYDPKKQRMETYSAEEKGKYHLPAYKQRDLVKDKKGVIWVTSDSLISYYDTKNKKFTPCFVLSGFPKNTVFEKMEIDPNNHDIIWITTRNYKNPENRFYKNVAQFNTKTKTLKKYSHDKKIKSSLLDNACLFVKADAMNRLWFLTKKGLSLYNPSTDNFTNFEFDPNNKIPFSIYQLASDKEGNIWIGGSFLGLWHLNVKTGISTLYSHTEEEGSLPYCPGGVNNIFFDKAQNLWLTLPCTGIAYENTQKAFFSILNPNLKYKGKEVKISDPNYFIISEVDDQSFFIYDRKNLLSWNTTLNTLEPIDLKVPARDTTINYIYKDKVGLLWINYWDERLRCYYPKTHKYVDYKNDPKDSTTIGSTNITKIVEDKNGTIWIGTRGNGLNSYDKKTKKFTRYPFIDLGGARETKDSLDDKDVMCLLIDGDGTLWIGTLNGGLNRMDAKTKKFKSFHNLKKGFYSVTQIQEESKHRLWLGTSGSGIYLFDKRTETYINYSEKEGMLCNSIMDMQKDHEGNIWTTSNRGLSMFNTKTNKFVNYTTANGLPTNTLWNIYKRANGLFYIGCMHATKAKYITFDPKKLVGSNTPPLTILESISYHPAHYKDIKKDSAIITTEMKNVTFAYNENKLTFYFTSLHFVNAPLNQYAYKLDGYDADWLSNGTQRTVTYTNLSPGDYTFHVKSSNSDGIWDEKGTQIKISILPPWYQTWWAYLSYALMLLLALRIFSKYRERHLRAEKEKLEKTVDQRTAELRTQKEIAEQQKLRAEESQKAKHQFLANMSHEIRTPMNAIKGMTDILIRRNPKDDQKEYLEGIKQSSDSLLVIINDILDISKIESGKIELEQASFSVNELINNVHTIMQFKAEEKGLELDKDIPNEELNVQGDVTRLRQILINLIGNAIKFTEKGTVTTSIKSEQDGNKLNLHFTVSDTGIGIDENRMGKIFESFEQAYSDTTRKFGGTGLGLSISKKLVELHNGKIWVESEKGKGSHFHFIIRYTIAESKSDVLSTEDSDSNIADSLKGIRILLVEDNAFNVVVAQEELEDAIEGVKVEVAENGLIAVEKLKSSTFDIILMDVQMPVMNGFEATQAIRNLDSEKNNTPIIAMTANVLKEEVDLCYKSGMNDFIGKPFETEELLNKIFNLINKIS
ncbi:MAG: response regulator [Sphingobacteriales bacterium]|nr:response regulator [Sphingobacteriales bacterium]